MMWIMKIEKKKKKEKKGNQNLKNIYFFGKAGSSNFLVFTGQTCKAILEIDPDLYAVQEFNKSIKQSIFKSDRLLDI